MGYLDKKQLTDEIQLGGPLREAARYWRPRDVSGVQLLRAQFRKQNFHRHFHRTYAFGVIEAGALGFDYLGRSHVAAAGEINLVVPGEPHDGHAASDGGWRYRMFYLDPDVLVRAASEMAGRAEGAPFFRSGVIRDAEAAARLRSLHFAFEDPAASRLELESRLLATLADMVRRHAENPPVPARVGVENQAVVRARDLIETCYDENISLEQLSRAAGLSRFHLLRVFRNRIGLTPHAYLTQVRVRRARALMDLGRPIIDAALEAGFTDQSHLNRQFKSIHGITPGQYRNSVQDR
jgi:AraC-like DNA-binding protein